MDKKMKIFTFLLLGLMLVSSIGMVTAQSGDDNKNDEDHDEVDDNYEHEEERNIEIEVESDKVQINSYSQNKDIQNKFEVKLELSDYVEIGVGFSSEVENQPEVSDTEQESEFEFGVKFKSIIEFVDLNNNSIYDGNSIDEFVQKYEFSSFKPIEHTSQLTDSNNTLHYFNISTTDDVFKLHLYVVEEFEIVNGTLVTPMEAKMDIEITNFNYLDAESQLALYVELESNYEYEYTDHTHDEDENWADHEEGYSTNINGENGFFTWEDFALVDGVATPVKYTPIANDDDDPEEDKIYFNYARGDHIFHDPKVGYAVLTTTNPTNWLNIGLIGGGAVVAIATVGILIASKKRR
jgi:hypothetical protein